MKPLSTPQKVLMLFCVWPADEVEWKKMACIIFTLCNLIANIVGLLASAAYFLKYVSIDMEDSLYGLFTVFGFAIAIYMVVFVFFSRHKIHKIFLKLTEIYDRRKKSIDKTTNQFEIEFHKYVISNHQMLYRIRSDFWHKQTTKARKFGDFC